jgi:hypothetical protein
MSQWIFKAEDIFSDIPDDSENVVMKIPDEVAEKAGLVPGDKLRILSGDQGTIIIEKLGEETDNDGE